MNSSNETAGIKMIKEKMHMFQNKLEELSVSERNGKVKCFISVGYQSERAAVFTGIGNNKSTAFKMAQDRAVKHIKTKSENPPWLKADFVVMEKRLARSEFLELASTIKRYYFKYGIAFDELYNIAFLHQEVNGACLLKYTEQERNKPKPSPDTLELAGISVDTDSTKTIAEINWGNVNHYLKTVRGQSLVLGDSVLNDVIIFETKSYFYDEEEFFELEEAELSTARRKISALSPEFLKDLLFKSSRYLANTVQDNGRFIYGYFSCFNKKISSYNVVRHALSVYSLSETYLVTKDEALLEPIRKSFAYLIGKYIYTVNDCAFVVEFDNNDEIKLGGLGVTVLAIVKYLEIFNEENEYLQVLRQIGNGIRYMQNEETGQFTHVLRFPGLEIVDQFRIVYYSGEAAFALMRIYSIDKNEVWLNSVKKAFEYFFAHDYWRNYDHWLAYCTNELAAVVPEDRYFIFGLKNAFNNLDFMMNRITTWATFLELLSAADAMVKNIKACGKEKLLEGYDLSKFKTTLHIRANRQLDGVFFPEHAMYFKSPETILYGAFIRHHIFRVRNDDVAHHLSGYCHYLTDILLSDDQ